jgi:hypothetical protein
MAFLVGFAGATLLGLLSTFLAGSWRTINRAVGRMNSPPHPALRPMPGGDLRVIGTDPAEAPMRVMNRSCSTILVQLILQVAVFFVTVFIIVSLPSGVFQEEIPKEAVYGILFAAALGVLTAAAWSNWTLTRNSYNRMVNPPAPTLPGSDPPNRHHLAAGPPLSPQQVVVGGCFEIVLRGLVQVVLLGLLIVTLRQMLVYLNG